jgi:hypothetical protein
MRKKSNWTLGENKPKQSQMGDWKMKQATEDTEAHRDENLKQFL